MSDIVERLRGAASKDYGCQCPKCEAADEIERLRAELAAAKQRIAELEPDFRVAALLLREEREELRAELAAAKDDLAAAIKQRDIARRMWCRIISLTRRGVISLTRRGAGDNSAPEDVAVEYGWDCFKEGGGA